MALKIALGERVQRRLITHLDKIHDKYNIYSSCTKVIKRSLIQQTGAQFPHQKIGEDALFMFQLYDIVDSYILIDKNYYYYRNRVDSAMHTPKDEVRLLEELVMFHYLDQLFIQHNENSMLPQKNAVHMIFLARQALRGNLSEPVLKEIQYFCNRNVFKKINLKGKVKLLLINRILSKKHHIRLLKK